MSSVVINQTRFKREQKYVTERIAELREELENLIDYLDLLEARARNFGKKRYSTEQVKKLAETQLAFLRRLDEPIRSN